MAVVDIIGYDLIDGFDVRTYVYLLQFVVHSDILWASIQAFGAAIYHARPVLYLFFSASLVVASMCVALLSGSGRTGDLRQYQTGDYYTDQQFEDFRRCFITMWVFLSTGANYVEMVTPSLTLDGGVFVYAVFFGCCTMVGMFFIFSLLVSLGLG